MCFLYLIQQHYGIGFPAHGLSKLAALIIAHIARRGAYQAAYTVFLLVFAHVDAGHHGIIVKEYLRQRLGQLCFAHTCSTEEYERAYRFAWVLQACTATAYSI